MIFRSYQVRDCEDETDIGKSECEDLNLAVTTIQDRIVDHSGLQGRCANFVQCWSKNLLDVGVALAALSSFLGQVTFVNGVVNITTVARLISVPKLHLPSFVLWNIK